MYVFVNVSLLAGLRKKNTRPILTKFDGKVAHGPRKKPLYFGGNQDHVTLGFGLRYGYIRLGGSTAMLDMAQ